MDTTAFLELTWIPIIVFAFSIGFGIKILVSGDIKTVRKDLANKTLKDGERYTKYAGWLLISFGLASLAMAFLLLFNLYVATGFIITAFIIIAVMWKRMDDKFGPL